MRAILLSSLSVALVVVSFAACPQDGTSTAEGEGEVEVLDSGVQGEGEGETGEGEGEGAGGEGEGEEGEGEGEAIQGEEYTTGVAEDGVKCGEGVVCSGATPSCCFDLVGAPTCAARGECADAPTTAEAQCDGGEDCTAAGTTECCLVGFTTQCVADDTCRETEGNREICVTTADCAPDELCCSDDALDFVGADGGVCLPAADNCVGQFGGG